MIWLKESPIPKIDFMTVQQLEQIRNCSKSKDDGPWVTFPEEMQKKSILRRSFKWIPTTQQIALAEELDNQDYDLTKAAVVTPGGNRQLGTDGTRSRMLAAMGQGLSPAAEQPATDTEFVPEGACDGDDMRVSMWTTCDPDTGSIRYTAGLVIGIQNGPTSASRRTHPPSPAVGGYFKERCCPGCARTGRRLRGGLSRQPPFL